ncbi:MAG: hypothetical protein J5689_02945 [Clostridia bacterium]|nr:hypothetical protein [Clostridia bacterium]
MNLLNFLFNIFFLDGADVPQDSTVTAPLYKFIDQVGPYAIGVVSMLSIILVIIFGVRYSKAEETKDRQAAQKQLISFVIGAVVILLLLVILYAIRQPLSDWANGN